MATSARTNNEVYLADVPQEFVFWCCDGRILKNLRELCDALGAMSDDTFAYHVNEAKNDFHNWAKDIIKDDALASDLLKAANSTAAARVVTERIAFLSRKPARAAAVPAKRESRRKKTRR
jgi:hypothetical protein